MAMGRVGEANEDLGVDANGFIRRAPRDPIAPEFLGVLKDVCAALEAQAGLLLHSLYLYGSVATGRAKPGVSDIDLSLVLQQPATQPELAAIESVRVALETRHPEVVKVDFDIGVLADVLSPAQELAWGYWLKHHCRCVLGEDLSERFQLFKPSRAIALAVNGDLEVVLGNYAQRIAAFAAGAQSASLQREAARKLIRATNVLRSSQDQAWPMSLQAHHAAFRLRFPSMVEELDFFMREATEPQASPQDFVRRLNGFTKWMSHTTEQER